MAGRNLVGRAIPSLLILLAPVFASAASGGRGEFNSYFETPDLASPTLPRARVSLSCTVIADSPVLGFDLRFHSGYRATFRIKTLAAAGGWLQAVIRLTPAAPGSKTVVLRQRFTIPDVPLDAKGDVTLSGGFDLGPGRYRVDWMIRDANERVCSSRWELEAKPGRGEGDLPFTLEPNSISGGEENAADYESQTQRDQAHPLYVKILLNLSPPKADGILSTADAGALLSILSRLVREPNIGRVSLVAFNLRGQKVVYQQEEANKIDFSALTNAWWSPAGSTIDYRFLQDRLSETHFVTKLLTDQLGARTQSPDAIIIVGPKVTLDRKVPLESLRAGGVAMCPIFYLNYNPNPVDEPWADTIGSALKAYKQAISYNIQFPHDLGVAMKKMLSRIVKAPTSRVSSAVF